MLSFVSCVVTLEPYCMPHTWKRFRCMAVGGRYSGIWIHNGIACYAVQVFYELLRLIRDHKLKVQKSFINAPTVNSPTSPNKVKVALDGIMISRQRTLSEIVSSWTDHKQCIVM